MCFKKTLCRIQDRKVKSLVSVRMMWLFRPDAHQSSKIRPDDENFPSGLPSASRSFELFQVAYVRMSLQHVRTPFSVRQVKGFRHLQSSRQRVYSVRTLSFIRQVVQKMCNCLDVSLHCSGRLDLIMKIAFNRSATVRMPGKHRSDVALFKQEYQRIWKAGCTVVRSDALSHCPDAT
jgi:hypothetical protein